MTRRLAALLISTLALPASAQSFYKCADSAGGMLISNSRISPSCVQLEVGASSPEPILGMSKKKVLSVSGEPSRKLISKKPSLVRETWFYNEGRKLVFENSILIEILSVE